jgi:phospholipid/cholesterol/gamma-HCH transport system ATP-binding protein
MNSVLQIGEAINFIYQGKLWWKGDKHTILNSGNDELNEFVFSTELTQRLRKT